VQEVEEPLTVRKRVQRHNAYKRLLLCHAASPGRRIGVQAFLCGLGPMEDVISRYCSHLVPADPT